jgi:hypothetical protein
MSTIKRLFRTIPPKFQYVWPSVLYVNRVNPHLLDLENHLFSGGFLEFQISKVLQALFRVPSLQWMVVLSHYINHIKSLLRRNPHNKIPVDIQPASMSQYVYIIKHLENIHEILHETKSFWSLRREYQLPSTPWI